MSAIQSGGQHLPIDPADAAAEVDELMAGPSSAAQQAELPAPPAILDAAPARGSAPRAAPPAMQRELDRKAEVLGSDSTALQKHAAFFDLDGDGKITVDETDKGMRMLGLAGISSRPTAFVINVGLGTDTSGKLLEVSVENIAGGIHEGDTGIFDAKGEIVPGKLDEVFTRFDADGDGKLTLAEIDTMIDTNNGPGLSKGKIAARGEFYLLLDLAGEKDPKTGAMTLTRERMERFYDGSLFFDIAAARAGQAAATGTDPHKGDVNRGLPGLAKTLGGVFAGSGAGAWLSNMLSFGREPAAPTAMAAPLSSAMLAVCPGMQAPAAGEG